MPNYVTDTHALIWYLASDKRLSPAARELFDAGEEGSTLIFVPTISLVEMVYLQEKNKIPEDSLAQLHHAIANERFGLRLFNLTSGVVTALAQISRESVPDMPDRIIAATALHLGAPLISRDGRIHLSAVETVW